MRLIIYFLLFYAINTNATTIENRVYEINKDLEEQQVIILPWSDCTNINSLSEEKLSFSAEQIKKEQKIHKKYEKYYLEHNNNPDSFSSYFSAKEPVTTKLDFIISNFLKICEDSFGTDNGYKVNSSNMHFKRQQQFLNKMKGVDNKIHNKKKYSSDIALPLLFKSD